MEEEKDFRKALKEKKVPILVLDQKWHRLFALTGKPKEVQQREQSLTALLERQGQLNNDLKTMKKLKRKLMDEVVANMEGTNEGKDGDVEAKRLEENRRMLDELNEKIEEAEDALLDIPAQIRSENEELMIESMGYCYEQLRTNMQDIDSITEWIAQVRKELKIQIIKKQNREINSRQIYSYMHDIFGMEILNLFDLKNEDVQERLEKKPKLKAAEAPQEEKAEDKKEASQE